MTNMSANDNPLNTDGSSKNNPDALARIVNAANARQAQLARLSQGPAPLTLTPMPGEFGSLGSNTNPPPF
jgi:hypothetical protein